MGVPKWLQSIVNATIKASIADAPAVTTASGYTINSKTGEVTQDATDDPGVKQLRDNLAVLGGTATGITAAPVVGAVVSNPVAQKLIGDTAASMLGGEVVDNTSRTLTGQSFGRGVASLFGQQNVYDRSALARFGYDALNPGYFAGNLVAKGTNAAIDAAGKVLKNADNYITIQNALRTGKLRFGEPTTYKGIHQSKTPLTRVQFPFQRWDVTTHGADPSGFWLTLADSPNTTGTMASRPYASRWNATSQKPLIQTGEVKGLLGKKNNTRNAIVKYGRKHGADAFEFRGIADNRLPRTDVVMVTEGTNPQYLGEISSGHPTTRLYRATGTSGTFTPSPDGTAEFAGQWFTDDPNKVLWYGENAFKTARRLGVENPIELQVVDIPTSQLEQFRAKNIIGDRKGIEFEPEDFIIPLDFHRRKASFKLTGNLLLDQKAGLPKINYPYLSPKTSVKSIQMEEPIMSVSDRISQLRDLQSEQRRLINQARYVRGPLQGNYYYNEGKLQYLRSDLETAKLELDPIVQNQQLKKLFQNKQYWDVYKYLKNSNSPILWEVKQEFLNEYNALVQNMSKSEALNKAGEKMRSDLLLLYTKSFKRGGKIKSIFKAQNGTFKDFWDSLPINQKDSTDFNVRRYWELWGKPKTFNEALEKGAYKLENDGVYHAFSGAWNENGEYEFTKSPQHPTVKYELDWFNSDDAKDFRSKYQLDSTSTPWKYKPINPQQ